MPRFRISLRLTLLAVAMFGVLFAWFGALKDMQRLQTKAELDDLKHSRQYAVINRRNFTSEKAWHDRVAELDVKISEKQKHLGSGAR